MDMFISYVADGVQHFSATGDPTTAEFTKLQYKLFAGKGDAVFGRAPSGAPTKTGMIGREVDHGDLIKGSLAFTPAGGIAGQISATSVANGAHPGHVNISVYHAAADIGHTATGGLLLTGGNLQASFTPAIPIDIG